MPRTHKTSGFTLLELLLVLLILATCAAIAAPTLKGFSEGRRLPVTATRFVTTARWCRVQAISEGATYRLNVVPDENRWFVTKDDRTTGLNFVPVEDTYIGTSVTVPDGITLSTNLLPQPPDNTLFISFDPAGRSDMAQVRFTAGEANLDITCDTPMAGYHIVKPEVTQ